jgi:excisionase family DNA binding protein
MHSYSAEKLLTAREAAELLHAHIATVGRWSRCGLLKSYRVGSRGHRRYKLEDIYACLEQNARDVRIEETK